MCVGGGNQWEPGAKGHKDRERRKLQLREDTGAFPSFQLQAPEDLRGGSMTFELCVEVGCFRSHSQRAAREGIP